MLNNLYNNRGVAKYQPGNLTHSDSRHENCFFPYAAPFYASTNFTAGFASNTTSTVVLTLLSTAETFSFTIFCAPTGFVVDSPSIVSQIQQYLPYYYTVRFDPTTNWFIFDTAIAGTRGAFNVTVNGTLFANNTVPGAQTNLTAGRFVVPVTVNFNTANGLPDSLNSYRYPVLGDSQDILAAGVFTIKDGHTNNLLIYDYNETNKIFPGTPFPGLSKGQMVLNAISAINPVSTVFVETLQAGDTLAGRLTNTPTATALQIPQGKLRTVSGSTIPNQLIEIRVNY
jgi:hypothetical protein